MLKPYDVFWASVIFFSCIMVILTTLLRNSAGVGDYFLMYGAILLTSGYYTFLAWSYSRRKNRTKNQSDSN